VKSYLLFYLQTQEKEAKDQMRKRAKELQRQRQEAEKSGRAPSGFGGGGFGSSSFNRGDRGDSATIIDTTPSEPTKPSYQAPRYVNFVFYYDTRDQMSIQIHVKVNAVYFSVNFVK
jgi:hypothetical protein